MVYKIYNPVAYRKKAQGIFVLQNPYFGDKDSHVIFIIAINLKFKDSAADG